MSRELVIEEVIPSECSEVLGKGTSDEIFWSSSTNAIMSLLDPTGKPRVSLRQR